MIYKIVFVLFTTFFIDDIECVTDKEMWKLIYDLHDICTNRFPVSRDIIDAINNDRIWSDDENLKCYIHCIMNECGVIAEDGTIDEDAGLALLSDDFKSHFTPIVHDCGTIYGSNPCETAWLTNKCYAKSEMYQLP